MQKAVSLFAVLCGALAIACSSTTVNVPSGSGDGGGGGGSADGGAGAGTGGTTACGIQTCQAGTYCLNMACVPGCLAETNCTSTQTCEKSAGNNTGSCQAKAQPPGGGDASVPAADCDTFCPKYQGCDPQGWSTLLSQCSQAKGRTCVCIDVCGSLKSTCISCFNAAPTCGDAVSCKTSCSSR